MPSTNSRDENYRAAIREIYLTARTEEASLLAEYAMIKSRHGTPLELPDDEQRIIDICHRMKSVRMGTHPEIQAIAEGGPLPPDPENP